MKILETEPRFLDDGQYTVNYVGLFKNLVVIPSTIVNVVNNKLHSTDDKPTVIYPNNKNISETFNDGKIWFQNGLRHRDTNPAMIFKDHVYWYIKDVEITDVVEEWIYENDLPDYTEWTDDIKIMFKLKFL